MKLSKSLCTGGTMQTETCWCLRVWKSGTYLMQQPFCREDVQLLDAPDNIPAGSHITVGGTVIPGMFYRGW